MSTISRKQFDDSFLSFLGIFLNDNDNFDLSSLSLTVTTIWAYTMDGKLMIIFVLVFQENRL